MNEFRSQLAESYLASKNLPAVETISSGTDAIDGKDLLTGDLTDLVLRSNGLNGRLSKRTRRTTSQMIARSDVIIFMTDRQFQHCRDFLGYTNSNYRIWNIQDLPDYGDRATIARDRLLQDIDRSAHIFACIKLKVDILVQDQVTKAAA
jgi:protein-tyrosine-phosphatase